MIDKPTCFVAMAFSKQDTDSLYDNQILPVLKRNGIVPVIINRRESNEDLNIQIIEQLNKCDFCITDLTYARPSVYYEAGYAERLVPVIYSVRKDHLKKGQSEDLRIHFDLQMKPLITWKNPEDTIFASRLERRLKATVLREWQDKKKEQSKLENAIVRFNKLAQSERLSLLRRRAISRLKTIEFSKWRAPWRAHGMYRYKEIMSGLVDGVYSIKYTPKSFNFVSVHSSPSATKVVLRDLEAKYSVRQVTRYMSDENLRKVKLVVNHHVVMSLRSIPTARIEDIFPWHRPIFSGEIYVLNQSLELYGRRTKKKPLEVMSNWHFLHGIKSEIHFREMLSEHIDEYIGKFAP